MDFREFVEAGGDTLVRFAFLLCHDFARAEDLVQESLFKAHRHWADIDHPSAYLRQVVLREYLSWRRRLSSREFVGNVGREDAVPDGAVGHAERDAMWRLLARLPARQRAVLVLRYYEDQSDEQIAATLGCARPTVRSLAARALATLRDDQIAAVAAATYQPEST